MKRTIGLLLVLALVAAACGDDDSADPLATCDGVAEATVDLVQDVIDELESMTPSEVGRLTQQGAEAFPAFAEIATRGDELGTRIEELGCTDIDALVAEKASRLEADPANGFTQLIVEGTRDGEDVLARLFR